jgi:transposase
MAMGAMMAVLKVDRDCQYTLSRVIDEAQRALAAQCKTRKRAHKLAKELAVVRQEFEESRGIVNYRLQQWGQVAHERDELHDQLMNLTIDRDEAV